MQFSFTQVAPNFGGEKIVVSWRVDRDEFEQPLKIYVYRSETGAGPWELLNPHNPVIGSDFFVDSTQFVNGLVNDICYRLLGVYGDDKKTTFESQVIRALGRASFRDFLAAGKMLRLIQQQWRKADGIAMLLYVPLLRGDASAVYDSVTHQRIRFSKDDTSYGMPFEGGFAPPLITMVRMAAPLRQTQKDMEDGSGVDEDVMVKADMPPFPRPTRGQMLVNIATDERFVVWEEASISAHRGVLPIVYSVDLQMLSKNDPRYKVSIPENLIHAWNEHARSTD